MSVYKGTTLIAGVPDISGKANTSLNNLDSTGQAVIDGKADVDLGNLSQTGQAVIDGKASTSLNNLDSTGQAVIDGKANSNLSNINNTGNIASSSLNAAGIRTVVETYKNGSNWYRVYSDGWVEQGGIVTGVSYNSSTNNLAFLKTFSDTNYTITVTSLSTQTNSYLSGAWAMKVSSTTARIKCGSHSGTDTSSVCWRAEGQGA